MRERINEEEMRFLRYVKGCTLMDHIRNEDIREEFGITGLQAAFTKNE